MVLEKKIFENGGRTDDGRTDDGQWLYYKLTNEPKGSGELKKNIVKIFDERQKSCNTLLIVILCQTFLAFENNQLSMIRQVNSNRFMHQQWNCPVRCGGIHKNVKNSDFDPKKPNQWNFRRKLWLFYVCMMFVMREKKKIKNKKNNKKKNNKKTQINLKRFVL